MREASFVMPVIPGSLTSLEAHDTIAAKLLQEFGGFTREAVEGAWRNDQGHIVWDRSNRYTVAMEDDGANAQALRAIALHAGRTLSQEAVYVRWADGSADILPVE